MPTTRDDVQEKISNVMQERLNLSVQYLSLRPYWVHEATYWKPINTLDFGKIQSGECYRIMAFYNPNGALALLGDEYLFYKTLPKIEGIHWVPAEDIDRYRTNISNQMSAKKAEYEALTK